MSSMGRSSLPRVPRNRLVKDCWAEVNRRRAAASVSANTTFTPTMACGRACWRDGLKPARYSRNAASKASGAKWEAKAYGNPSMAASCAP